jgi:orotate phosphoribosyltransferase
MPNSTLLDLVSARRGHFLLESGLHASLWLDLNGLFADQRRIEPHADALAAALRGYDAGAVCGPLLGGAFLAQLLARSLSAEFWFAERVEDKTETGLFRARYRLPRALASRAKGRRVAVVDDVMSAGSSLRATHAELSSRGAIPVAVGALIMLGTVGQEYFNARKLPVEAVERLEFETWAPSECPLCAAGVALENPASQQA